MSTNKSNDKINAIIEKLIKRIDENPNQTSNYLELSDILLEQGSFDQANQLLKKAAALVNQPKELSYNLVLSEYFLGNFSAALKILEKMPNTDANLYQKSLVYFKLGQPEKALAFVLSIKKNDEHTFELLGDLWLSLGDLKSAKNSFLQIPKTKRTAKTWFLLSVTTISQDQVEANKYLKKAKELDNEYVKSALVQYNTYLNNIQKGKIDD